MLYDIRIFLTRSRLVMLSMLFLIFNELETKKKKTFDKIVIIFKVNKNLGIIDIVKNIRKKNMIKIG